MTPYPLHRSDTSTRILITLFLVFIAGSFTVALLNVYDKVGRVPNGVVERYGPDIAAEHTKGAPAVTKTGGIYDEPAVANDSASERPAAIGRVNTFSALLDVTHPHIFEMPLIILVLCHFLMRTGLASWAKVLAYGLSFGGVAGMLVTPWLVRYVSIRFAPVMLVSAVALALSALPLILVPLWEMWVRPWRQRAIEQRAARISAQYVVD